MNAKEATENVGAIVSDKFHYNAGAFVSSSLVRLGSHGRANFVGLVHDAGDEVMSYLKGGAGSYCNWESVGDLTKILSSRKITHVLTDDYLPRMKAAAKACHRTGIPYLVYAHIPYGFGAISRLAHHCSSNREKGLEFAAALVPFKALTRTYVELLLGAQRILPNSGFTQALLAWVYGVVSGPIAYPAVERDFLAPPPSNVAIKPNTFAIYFGNSGELTRQDLKAVGQYCTDQGFDSGTGFGDYKTAETFKDYFSGKVVLFKEPLTSQQIVRLLSTASITIAPQKYELFGLVGPESILCGTPVALANYQPWLELTGRGKFCSYIGDTHPASAEMTDLAEIQVELDRAQATLKKVLSPEALASTIVSAVLPPKVR